MLELRPYQKEAIQATYDYWNNNVGINPVIVCPTGGGKSLLIAKICEDVVKSDDYSRVLMLTHSAELIDQNFKELKGIWNEAPAGIFSASLKKRDLKNSIIGKEVKRKQGKTTKYKLGGSILIDDEYILTAFSRFNKNNQAELTIQEYVNFLLTFWNEINRLYAQRSVTVPVFGAGITRFKNGFEDIDINELLRIMVWTFKISKIKFAYPAKLTIIVHDDLLSQVNLYELKENE